MRFRGRLLGLALAAVAALAGCGGAGRHTASPLARPAANARTIVRRRSLGVPFCSTATDSGPALHVRTAMLGNLSSPFGVASPARGRWSFVDDTPGHVVVLSDRGFLPRRVRSLTTPREAVGNAITRDGRYLLVADGGNGATVISVARAEAGDAHAVLGTLAAPLPLGARPASGAIEAIASADGDYVFVSVEYGDLVAVYDLRTALADHFRSSGYVGSIPLGEAVVGSALSPDGRWLYVTSELGAGARSPTAPGTLSVISVARAERDPAHSVLATADAGCAPVRVALSADGSTVWVSARESDELLAFSAASLRSDPRHALLAAVRVGTAPVGLALVDGGRDIIVADSNRFSPGAAGALTAVSVAAALRHRPAVLGTIRAGSFPREMALEPSGRTLLVGDFGSGQLEAVDVAALP